MFRRGRCRQRHAVSGVTARHAKGASPRNRRWRTSSRSAESLAEEDPNVVAAGPAGQLADRLVTEPPVERGRLIAVRVEVHLMAAAAPRLRFGRGDQARAEPKAPKLPVDPDGLHESGPTPGPPVETRHDRLVAVAHEDGERAPVVDAARGRVELVEPVVEECQVLSA